MKQICKCENFDQIGNGKKFVHFLLSMLTILWDKHLLKVNWGFLWVANLLHKF